MKRHSIRFFLLGFILFLGLGANVYAHERSYFEIKKELRQLWQAHPITFYCGCGFDKQLRVDFGSCSYQPEDLKKAKRVEWEHIVPVSWFGHQRPCWRQNLCRRKNGKYYSGRNCCEKIDPEFKAMYTDMHNIVPAIGEVNQARKHYRFSEFSDKTSFDQKLFFNDCDLIIDEQNKKVYPRDEIKGMIARAFLYMASTYDFKLSSKQKTLFECWHKTHPPTDWEKEWNQKIKDIQGTDNPYISHQDP